MVSKHAQEEIDQVKEEKCNIDGCQMDKTGVCALHDVEVERRKGMKDLVDKIPMILTKMNLILGTSFLIGIFIIGSYAYTNITKNDIRDDMIFMSKQNQKKLDSIERRNSQNMEFMRDTVLSLTSSVSNLKTMQLENIKNSDELNETLRSLIQQQREHERIVDKAIETAVESECEKTIDGWGNSQ